jgi:small subunit ribosomal protein S7
MQRARQLCCRLVGCSSQPSSLTELAALQQQPSFLLPALLQQLAPPSALLSAQQQQQQQQHQAYATRGLNQKDQKRQNKTDKKALKKSAVPQSGAGGGGASGAGGGGGDSAAAFSDEVQAMEADVTRLVLQVRLVVCGGSRGVLCIPSAVAVASFDAPLLHLLAPLERHTHKHHHPLRTTPTTHTQAIHNVMPVLDARTIRSATNVSYVPGLMPPRKARSLALHWLVKAADSRSAGSKASYAECLALELLLAYQKRGAARQKRDDLHKLALQNRANVHMRWW